MLHNLSKTPSILNQFVAELRDVNLQSDSLRFRNNLERIGEVMAYEISKTLDTKSVDITTPFGISREKLLEPKIVVATVLRAGIPLHKGLLNYFDQAESAFVSAFRKPNVENERIEVEIEYLAGPNLNGKTLILADPMLATGTSIALSYEALLHCGSPAEVHIVVAIASAQGVKYIQKKIPKTVKLWCAAIDPELNAKSYIVPGLGDAGDLAYGEKL